MPTDNVFFDPAQTSTHRSMTFLACGALIGLAIAGYGLFTAKGTRSRRVPAEAVALVNQRQVLRSDFMTQTANEYSIPFAQTTHEQRENTLQHMIDEELMMQRGLEIDLPSYDPDVRNALVAGVELEVTAEVIAQQPTDAELHAYYDRHLSRYASEGVMQLRDLVATIDARHSPASAQATAKAAVVDLRAGQPIDSVMKLHGLIDSGHFMAGGRVDVGDIFDFAVRAKVDAALYRAIAALHDGEISDPIAEIDGVHVIAMRRHQLPVAQSFEQANDHVWNDFKHDAVEKVRAANLRFLHDRADLLVAPDYAQ